MRLFKNRNEMTAYYFLCRLFIVKQQVPGPKSISDCVVGWGSLAKRKVPGTRQQSQIASSGGVLIFVYNN